MKNIKGILTALFVLVAAVLVLSSCSSGGQASAAAVNGPASGSQQVYKASWVNADITGSKVSIPVKEVETRGIVNFKVASPTGQIEFMTYQLDGKIQVRADICPPCRSQSFTLQNGRLTCDICGTVFSAVNGMGIQGACVAYPKAAVTYENNNGVLTMNAQDLQVAFQNTMRGNR